MRAVVFTDKFGRTVMVTACFPNADPASSNSHLSAAEIVRDVLEKVPGSEFVRSPSMVSLSDDERARVFDKLRGKPKEIKTKESAG